MTPPQDQQSSGPVGDPFDDPDIWSSEPSEPAGPRRPPRPPRAEGPAPGPRPGEPGGARGARPVASAPPATSTPPPARPDPIPPAARRAPAPDDDYVDLPPESRVPRWVAALVVVGLVVVVVVGGAWAWYGNQVDPSGDPGAEVVVVVPEGATAGDVADLLDERGVISNALLFGLSSASDQLGAIQAGTYRFQEGSSFDEAVAVLAAGPDTPVAVATTKLTIPEGLTVRQTLERISETIPRLTVEDLQAALDGGQVPSSLKPAGVTSYEGLLFPATYDITDDDTALDVLTMMAAEMETRAAATGLVDAVARAEAETGLDLEPYDLLTIASLVQEEAGNPEEAPKIARVIENRLRDGWALGIDATSRYLAELEGTEVDFSSTSPYNTRTQRGLPPTPIAAPGEFALAAAAAPAEGPWMYYVLTDPGQHTFVVTDAEFQAAKQECIAKDLGCG